MGVVFTVVVLAVFALETSSEAQSGIPMQEAKLAAATATVALEFGKRVAIAGDTAAVTDNFGVVHLFERAGTTWAETTQLSGNYASAVDVAGEIAVVGAVGDSTTGAAYVFIKQGANWVQQAELAPVDLLSGDRFGTSVSISGSTIAVGADPENDNLPGAVYVFAWDGQNWVQQGKLVVDAPYFGEQVAVSGDTLIASSQVTGAKAIVFARSGTSWSQQAVLLPAQQSTFTGPVDVSGDAAIVAGWDYALGVGAAYVFVRTATQWAMQAELTIGQISDLFGSSVAISDYDDVAVVGARWAYLGAESSGAAYVFVRNGATWTHQGTLVATDAVSGDELGLSVALSGQTVIAGAWKKDDGTIADAGAAYVFNPIQPWTKLAAGLAGVAGVPVLEGAGTLDAGSAGSLVLSDSAPFKLTMLFVSLANTPTPFKGGTLSALPIAFQLPVGTFFTGSWTLPWSAWPPGVPPGSELYFQVGVSDGAAIHGVAISNLLKATQP